MKALAAHHCPLHSIQIDLTKRCAVGVAFFAALTRSLSFPAEASARRCPNCEAAQTAPPHHGGKIPLRYSVSVATLWPYVSSLALSVLLIAVGVSVSAVQPAVVKRGRGGVGLMGPIGSKHTNRCSPRTLQLFKDFTPQQIHSCFLHLVLVDTGGSSASLTAAGQ